MRYDRDRAFLRTRPRLPDLIQNAFPITEQFIDHLHIEQGGPVQISQTLEQEIRSKLYRVLSVHRRTGGILFTDVERVMKVLDE